MPSMVTATSSPTLRGPTPAGVPVRIDVAGEQRHGLGDVDDQVLDGVDHLAGAAELALLAVDGELDGEVGRGSEVQAGLDRGAQRAGGKGPKPLARAHCSCASGRRAR